MENTNDALKNLLNTCIEASYKCIKDCKSCKLQAAADDHIPLHCDQCLKSIDNCVEACKNVNSACRDHLKVCSDPLCIESVVECIKVNENCISVAQHAKNRCTENYDEQCGLASHESNRACDKSIQACKKVLEHLCAKAT